MLDIRCAPRQHYVIVGVLATFIGTMAAMVLLPGPTNEHQQSVNDFWYCTLDNSRVLQQATFIFTILAAFISKIASEDIATTS